MNSTCWTTAEGRGIIFVSTFNVEQNIYFDEIRPIIFNVRRQSENSFIRFSTIPSPLLP